MTLKDDKNAKASEIINEKYSETFHKLSECNPIRVGFKRLTDDAIIPTKAHATDSGFDLYASKDVIIEPGETTVVPTGIAVELPPGYEATVRPRSGITAKTKLRVQLGTIDNEYRGEIGVIVDNIYHDCIDDEEFTFRAAGLDDEPTGDEYYPYGTYLIRKGNRIAQLVIQPIPTVEAYEVEGELEETERGEGGFGSSGVRDESNNPGIVVGYNFDKEDD